MADLLDLVTLPEAYEAVNNPAAAGHDARLGRWVTGVSQRIDDLCGPVVVRTVTDELHDGGVATVTLRQSPVDTVTTVTEYAGTVSTVLTAETNATKPADGYLVEAAGKLTVLRRRSGNGDSVFPSGRRNVTVTYEAGRYADTASVDGKFKTAVESILRRLWSREAGSWAAGGDPYAEVGTGTAGFFRAVDPMVNEWLADEVRTGGIA